eukprot:RCo033276
MPLSGDERCLKCCEESERVCGVRVGACVASVGRCIFLAGASPSSLPSTPPLSFFSLGDLCFAPVLSYGAKGRGRGGGMLLRKDRGVLSVSYLFDFSPHPPLYICPHPPTPPPSPCLSSLPVGRLGLSRILRSWCGSVLSCRVWSLKKRKSDFCSPCVWLETDGRVILAQLVQ